MKRDVLILVSKEVKTYSYIFVANIKSRGRLVFKKKVKEGAANLFPSEDLLQKMSQEDK